MSKRRQSGSQLIELLVAVLCLMYFSAGVMDQLTKVHRQMTESQNQIIAADMSEELFDMARDLSFGNPDSGGPPGTLSGYADGAWHPIMIYSTGGINNAQPDYIKRPLLLDLASGSGFHYSSGAANALFQGTVKQQLSNQGNGQIQMTVQVNWPSENGGAARQSTMSTMISQYGIHSQ